jgi:hypothetical protein
MSGEQAQVVGSGKMVLPGHRSVSEAPVGEKVKKESFTGTVIGEGMETK